MDFLFPTFGHHHEIPFDSFWPQRASRKDNRWLREQEYLRQQHQAAKEAAAYREALRQRHYFQQLHDQQAKLKRRRAGYQCDQQACTSTKSDTEDADNGRQWREKRAAEIVRLFTEATTVIQRAWRRYRAVNSARSLVPSLRCLASIRTRARATPAVGFDTLKGRRIFEHTLEKLTEESDAVDGCGSDLVRQLRKSTVVLIQSRLSELDDVLVAPVEAVEMDSEPEGSEAEPPSPAPPSAGTGENEGEASNVLEEVGESSDSHGFEMVPEKIIDELRLEDTAYGTLTDDDDRDDFDDDRDDGDDSDGDGSDGSFTPIEAVTQSDE